MVFDMCEGKTGYRRGQVVRAGCVYREGSRKGEAGRPKPAGITHDRLGVSGLFGLAAALFLVGGRIRSFVGGELLLKLIETDRADHDFVADHIGRACR